MKKVTRNVVHSVLVLVVCISVFALGAGFAAALENGDSNTSQVTISQDGSIYVTYQDIRNGTIRDDNGTPRNGTFDVYIQGVSNLPGGFYLKGVSIADGSITQIDSYEGLTIAGMSLNSGVNASFENGNIRLEGGIKLPVVPAPSGAFVFAIRDNEFVVQQGSVMVPRITVPKLFGMEGNLTIGENIFDLNGAFGMRGLGGDPTKVGWIGGGATIRNDFIDRIALRGDSLNIKLGDTGAFLDSISAEVRDITEPKNLTLSGDVTIIGGPKIAGLSAIKVDVAGSMTPAQGAFSLSGQSYLFTVIQMSDQSVSARLPENIHLYSKVFYQPWVTGTADIRFNNNGSPVFYGSMEASLELNFKILGHTISAKFGGIKVAVSDSYIEGTVSTSINLIFFTKEAYATMRLTFGETTPSISAGLRSHYESWETPHNPIYTLDEYTGELVPVEISSETSGIRTVSPSSNEEPKTHISFLNNWVLLDKVYLADPSAINNRQVRIASDLTANLTVPENVGDAVVRINFENTGVNEVIAEVRSSNGDVVENRVIFEPLSQEAFLWLEAPPAGDYTVVVANQETLGNAAVELIQIDAPPAIGSFSVASTGNPDEYLLEWEDFDLESDAEIRFSLSEDRDGADGFYFATAGEDNETNSLVFNTQDESITVPSGDYYVIMEIDDGVNAPVYTVSNTRIRIIDPQDPLPVTGLSAGGSDGKVHLRWNKPDDDRIVGYTILYTHRDDIGHFDNHIAVEDPDLTEYTIENVENGVPLLVTVVSIDENTNRSIAADVVRVIPHELDGTTSPAVVSQPSLDAEVGELYLYSPQFANSERFVIAEYELETVVVSAPAGLEIDAFGDVVWVPAQDQVGEHEVTIRHNFHFIQSDTTEFEEETFVIDVTEAGTLNGEETDSEILSQPDISAVENSLYTYQVEVNDPDGTPTFVLAEGPEGMTVDASGLVQWQVPEFTSAYFPVRIVVTFANGEVEEQDYILDIVTDENTLQASSVLKPLWNGIR